MSSRRAVRKLLVFKVYLAQYFANGLWLLNKYKNAPMEQRRELAKNISFYARKVTDFLNIKVITKGNIPDFSKQNFLIVSNHLTYIDIPVLSSIAPSCYVTSVEVKETPFLGEICKMGACVFVERRNKKNIKNEIHEITDSLENGINVTIFPEATSTNGEEVIRFRRPLYNAALFSETPILPVTINYIQADANPIDLSNRDNIFWYGDMPFFPHLMRFLSYKEVRVELTYHDPIPVQKDSVLESLVNQSHRAVSEVFRPITSSLKNASL